MRQIEIFPAVVVALWCLTASFTGCSVADAVNAPDYKDVPYLRVAWRGRK